MSNLRTSFPDGFGSGGARLTDGTLRKNLKQIRDEFDVLITTTDAVSAGVKATKTLADASANTIRLDAVMAGDQGNELWYESKQQTVGGASVFDLTIYGPDVVTQKGKYGYVFTAAAATDLCTYGGANAQAHGFTTGDGPFRLESSTTLPAGLATTALYWVIASSTTTFQLATTKANAIAETAVDITDTGTGTHKIYPMADPEVFSTLSMTSTADRYFEKIINGELGVSFTAAATDICTTAVAHNMLTGDGPYRLGTTGADLPAGLSELLEYFIVASDVDASLSSTTFKLATSLANARAGSVVNITDAGTGTHRLYKINKDVGAKGSQWVTAQDLASATTDNRPADTSVPVVLASGANEVTATGVNRGDYVVSALDRTTPAALATLGLSCTGPDKLVSTAGLGASLSILLRVRPKP